MSQQSQQSQSQNQSQSQSQTQLRTWNDILDNHQDLLHAQVNQGSLVVYQVSATCEPAPQWNESSHEDFGTYLSFKDAEIVLLQAIDNYIRRQIPDEEEGRPNEVGKGHWEFQFENDGYDYVKSWDIRERKI